jgi:hypothetical protein
MIPRRRPARQEYYAGVGDCSRERLLAAVAGFEPLHLGIRSAALAVAQSAHLTPFVGHPRLLPTRCAPDHFRMEMQRFESSRLRLRVLANFAYDAEVRILPPQPASPSLTHTESGRARNVAKWRHFAHKGWSRARNATHCPAGCRASPESRPYDFADSPGIGQLYGHVEETTIFN